MTAYFFEVPSGASHRDFILSPGAYFLKLHENVTIFSRLKTTFVKIVLISMFLSFTTSQKYGSEMIA